MALVWVFLPFVLPVLILAVAFICWKTAQPFWIKASLVGFVSLLAMAWGLTAGQKLFFEHYYRDLTDKNARTLLLPANYNGALVVIWTHENDSAGSTTISVDANGIARASISLKKSLLDQIYRINDSKGELVSVYPSLSFSEAGFTYVFLCFSQTNPDLVSCEWPAFQSTADVQAFVELAIQRGEKINEIIPMKSLVETK